MGILSTYFSVKKKKEELRQCFKLAKIGREVKGRQHDYMQYPKIHDVMIDEELEATRYVFTLPTGVDPSLLTKNIWVFKQMYGENVELKGSYKKFILWVFDKGMPTKVKYNFAQIEKNMQDKTVPLVLGYDRRNQLIVGCLKELHHVLLTGTTGSGKSTLFRSMITSLILHKDPSEIQLIMADFKKSEFGIYRNLPHVKNVHMDRELFHADLQYAYKELQRRGALLDKYDLDHVSELEDKLPIIMIVIDEMYEIVDHPAIMALLTKISCLGRSSQVHIIGAMQRGDAASLGGMFLSNMNCRISGKQADSTNAKIAGLKTSKDIAIAGRMAISLFGEEQFIQVPYITKQDAKKLLGHLKSYPMEEDVKFTDSLVEPELNEESLEETYVNDFIPVEDDDE
jgi:DNA segregation ATPase FtsK/SpoIIIE, S-DNA-T family